MRWQSVGYVQAEPIQDGTVAVAGEEKKKAVVGWWLTGWLYCIFYILYGTF